jgi:hypothetical protein
VTNISSIENLYIFEENLVALKIDVLCNNLPKTPNKKGMASCHPFLVYPSVR